MENGYNKDNALRQAVNNATEANKVKLPSNFAFTTMRRIEAERCRTARRNRITAIVSLAAMCSGGIATLVYLCADAIISNIKNMSHGDAPFACVVPMVICLSFFAVLNTILRKRMNG